MAAIPYVPDKGTAQNDIQSIRFSLDDEVLSAAALGLDGIITGCELTQQASPDMTVAVAAGVVISNDAVLAYAGGNATIGTADSTNPRIDLIVINSSGSLATRAGTAAAAPKPPARTANDVILGHVYVPASDTTITEDQITRARLAMCRGPEVYFIRADGSRTLTSTTSAQKLFGDPTNGALTLPTGTYEFWAVLGLTSMSATSGNAQMQILGGGTATLSDIIYHTVGVDGASGTAATQTGSWSVASSSAASALTAGTGTAAMMRHRGSFEVSAAGTIIPSIALVTAAAAVLASGSFFACRLMGSTSAKSRGPWS